jgi:hypothetical protein
MKRSTGSIQCLNGIRAISLLWIIFGHRYFDMFLAPSVNKTSATEAWLKSVISLFHTTFHLAVDNFFLMGGLLVTWSFMKSFDKYLTSPLNLKKLLNKSKFSGKNLTLQKCIFIDFYDTLQCFYSSCAFSCRLCITLGQVRSTSRRLMPGCHHATATGGRPFFMFQP